MNEDDKKYREFLTEVCLDLRKEALSGIRKATVEEVVATLSLHRDLRMVRDVCNELGIATKREFDREVRRAKQRETLGVAPANATELVTAFAEKHKLTARFDGKLAREILPMMRIDGQKELVPITREDRKAKDVDLYATFVCDARSRLNRIDLERELRVLSANFQMGFNHADITDAVAEWFKKAQRERLHDIYVGLEGKEPYFDASKAWIELAGKVFDCSDHSPDFVAAVLRKFIWQVKRKLRLMPVTDHLMPVILGPQGIGKSTLVNYLLGPVEELKLNVDFRMVTDDRNTEIWDSYVMFLDEMGFASKSDIDTVKNIITASTLTRRPMRSNSKVTIDQNATFIGCSNKELGQLVRDPTGIRRFVGIRMRSGADRAFINGLDWGLMWGNVLVSEDDPMLAHSAVLSAEQEESRERGRVEQWMHDFDGANNAYQSSINAYGNIHAKALYLAFREYEEDVYPGHFKTSKTDWNYEMSRLSKNQPDSVVFSKKRGGDGIMYRWIEHKDTSSKVLTFPKR